MAGIVKLQQMLECPHCRLNYKNPQILNCQHTLCKSCVDELQRHTDDVTCPVCDATTAAGDVRPDINKEQLLMVCKNEDAASWKPERPHHDEMVSPSHRITPSRDVFTHDVTTAGGWGGRVGIRG